MTRLFGLPPGVDFPKALVAGLEARFAHLPPHDWARITLILNTRRMARRVRAVFDAGPPRLLPRIILLSDLDTLLGAAPPPPAIPPLRRRFELAVLVARLVKGNSSLSEQSSVYGLADSLATLMDEMQGEGVSPEALSDLDVSGHSEHFHQTKAFLSIVSQYLGQSKTALDPEARQRQLVRQLIAEWQTQPPSAPVILAGSTASRGTTHLLAEAIARLDQGFVVLPGFDFDLPDDVWAALDGDSKGLLPTQDHPQYRFRALMQSLNLGRGSIEAWSDLNPPSAARNRLVSLALRPAPVTDAWLDQGPALDQLDKACANMTLIEAESPRAEALAIALRLREAAETGQTAAVVSPDRMLTRQVAAALDRWNIKPDDSAGLPLHHSPPGRLLRHTADLMAGRLGSELLLTLLKHPLTHRGAGRNTHLLNTQRLEFVLRDTAMAFPEPDILRRECAKLVTAHGDEFGDWLNWVIRTFCNRAQSGPQRLEQWHTAHQTLAEQVVAGQTGDATELWAQNAGEKACKVFDQIAQQADAAPDMSAFEYAELLGALLSAEEVRDRDEPFADIMIWGTLESRVQGADLVILAGLNDGTWPEAPSPDPWLNRDLRHQAGLLLPDRRIGLAAHDFQQAIGANEVWLTRAVRNVDAETVPSRWLNRLTNLLAGLEQGAPELEAMRARGQTALHVAQLIETPIETDKAGRPAPRPPVTARPRKLSVSDIRRLVRDPYAVYARKVLGLSPLGPLRPSADALLRGTTLHKVFELFLHAVREDQTCLTRDTLLDIAQTHLGRDVPWATARTLWFARLEGLADWFIETETRRQSTAEPFAFEIPGRMTLPDIAMDVTAKADRIDLDETGRAIVLDYKTGTPPSAKQQKSLEKQLLIEAAMLEVGAFEKLGPREVAAAQYIGLTRIPSLVDAPLEEEPTDKVMAELRRLLGGYLVESQGYASRRAYFKEADTGDYDHLARFGEWDGTQWPMAEKVG